MPTVAEMPARVWAARYISCGVGTTSSRSSTVSCRCKVPRWPFASSRKMSSNTPDGPERVVGSSTGSATGSSPGVPASPATSVPVVSVARDSGAVSMAGGHAIGASTDSATNSETADSVASTSTGVSAGVSTRISGNSSSGAKAMISASALVSSELEKLNASVGAVSAVPNSMISAPPDSADTVSLASPGKTGKSSEMISALGNSGVGSGSSYS